MMSYSNNKKLFFDTECYPNYFLIAFKDESDNVFSFEIYENAPLDIGRLKNTIRNKTLIGFNSKMYDIPMISYALSGANNAKLKKMSNLLVSNRKSDKDNNVKSSYDIICDHQLWQIKDCNYDHIDLINVAKGKCSLKLYGARMGSIKLQDLPYDHLKPLGVYEKEEVKKYCINDINITIDLYKNLSKELEVRENLNKEFNIDSRSKSDAQIADLVIGKACDLDSSKIEKELKFKFQTNLSFNFKTEALRELYKDLEEIEFETRRFSKIKNEKIRRKITINETTYAVGIGGLHSNEKARSLIANENEWFIDIDVSSCYPKIILNNKLSPPQIKKGFLDIYEYIFYERLIAKKNEDKIKSDVLKIILNGSFGKFGDGYSNCLYAPRLLLTTTITGQLGLLILIERLEEYGFNVISANTDGIIAKVNKNKYSQFRNIIEKWENKFDYSTEEIKYKALYSHSVNSYIAIKENKSLKLKGLFAENDLSRNIDVPICKKAVINYLTKGTKIEDSIYNKNYEKQDLLKIRKTKFGGYWNGKYLGHTVRWYWSTKGQAINNSKGHKVAETNDAWPIMDLNDDIKNLHYEKYINKSYELLKMIGVN